MGDPVSVLITFSVSDVFRAWLPFQVLLSRCCKMSIACKRAGAIAAIIGENDEIIHPDCTMIGDPFNNISPSFFMPRTITLPVLPFFSLRALIGLKGALLIISFTWPMRLWGAKGLHFIRR